MRYLLITFLLLPVFLGGKPDDLQIEPCTCMDTIIPMDSFIAVIAPIIAGPVDSFRAVKERELDSLSYLKDSLTIELYKIKREQGRKLVTGRIDDVPGEYWYWKYWKYPNGTMEYDTVIIIPKSTKDYEITSKN